MSANKYDVSFLTFKTNATFLLSFRALTTILALRTKNIEIAGVILNGKDDDFDNYGAIEYYGKVDVLDKIPYFDTVNKNTVMNYKLCDKALKKLLGE